VRFFSQKILLENGKVEIDGIISKIIQESTFLIKKSLDFPLHKFHLIFPAIFIVLAKCLAAKLPSFFRKSPFSVSSQHTK
jgi:hypothetical protein